MTHSGLITFDAQWRGQLTMNASLAHYTSWRAGGPANRIYFPADVDDLVVFLQTLPASEPLLWLGLGSNTLIRDGGFPGTVLMTQGRLNQFTQINAHTIRAEAGVSCATLARFSARLALQGAEFLAGIPGTIGGALAMNAGCFGGEMWDNIAAVETIDRQGVIRRRTPQDFQIAYRSVILRQNTDAANTEWFIAGYFQLTGGDREQSLQKIRTLLDHRAMTQPTGDPTCGSVFRNPTNDYAGRLIERCHLKGFRIGGAYVSEKHANFIINDGTATATDIENLVEYIKTTVANKQQIHLDKEVHIIGNPF